MTGEASRRPAGRGWRLASLRSGAATAVATRAGSQGLAFAAPLLIVHHYGASAFGFVAMLISVSAVSAILEWGQPLPLQNEVSRRGLGDLPVRAWILARGRLLPHLGLNAAAALLLFLTRDGWLSLVVPGSVQEQLVAFRPAMAGALAFAALSGATYQGLALLNGLGLVDTALRIGLLANAGVLAAIVACAWAGLGVEYVAIAYLAGALVERLLALAYCLRFHHRLAHQVGLSGPVPGAARRAWIVPLAFLYLQVLSLVANNIDALFASRAQSMADVGEYSFLLKLYGVPLLVMSVLNARQWPRLASAGHAAPDAGVGLLWTLIGECLAVAAVSGLVMWGLSGPAYALLTGTALRNGALPWLLGLYVVSMGVRGPLTTYVNSVEQLSANLVGNTVFLLAAVPLKAWCVDNYGVGGLPVANVVSYAVVLLPFHVAAVILHRRGVRETSA